MKRTNKKLLTLKAPRCCSSAKGVTPFAMATSPRDCSEDTRCGAVGMRIRPYAIEGMTQHTLLLVGDGDSIEAVEFVDAPREGA